MLLICSVLLACAQTPDPAAAPDRIYDVYYKGIRLTELTYLEGRPSPTYSVRDRDPRTLLWSEPKEQRADSVRIGAGLAQLPGLLSQLEAMRWQGLQTAGWEYDGQAYVRDQELFEDIDDEALQVTYWAAEDASRPLDLILDENNKVIAGIDVSQDACMVLRGYEAFTSVDDWMDPNIPAAEFGIANAVRHKVEMSDGVQLETLVYLPAGGIGPFPVIFVRTPYGISSMLGTYWHYMMRGYALVFQACRGTAYWDGGYQSEGTFELCINEPSDGAEALEWIVQQDWCDGNIGMQGGSYVGYTQWACTMADNPALKCIIPESSMGTVFSDQPYMGGGFVQGLAYYMLFMLQEKLLPGRTWSDVFQHRPLIDLDEYACGRDVPQWNTLLENWSNNEYWEAQDWYRPALQRKFASFQISGWFDDDLPGTLSNWSLMQFSEQPQRLIIGPWKHGYNVDRKLLGHSFGTRALRQDIWLLKQRWYDRFLLGIDNGIEDTAKYGYDEDRVQYFALGANEWWSASHWPPIESLPTPMYFHSDGRAQKLMTSGRLTKVAPTEAEPPEVYTYDPSAPVTNPMSFEQMKNWEDVQSFPYDFQAIETRHDVVVYSSEELTEDLNVAGWVTVELYASCDVLDTDWWCYVADVYPDGTSVRLTTGMLRARFRELEDPIEHISGANYRTEKLLSGDPDEIVHYRISMPSIANCFKKGHRIRVGIMNACDNYGFPNSNTGGDEAHVTETVKGKMVIHHDCEHPSHLVLPVLRG